MASTTSFAYRRREEKLKKTTEGQNTLDEEPPKTFYRKSNLYRPRKEWGKGTDARAEGENGCRTENVDAIDFRKHFGLLKVSDKEDEDTKGTTSSVNIREVTVQGFSGRNENSSKDSKTTTNFSKVEQADASQTRKTESANKQDATQSETSLATTFSKEVESVEAGRSSISSPDTETLSTKSLKELDLYETEVQALENKAPVSQNLSDIVPTFNIHKVLLRDKNPLADVEPAQLGFVNYLFDKAMAEITSGQSSAAKPYIERLRLIDRTERVLGALEDEYYGRIIEGGVSKLNSDGLKSALLVLDELKEPSLSKYKNILQGEITEHLKGAAIKHIHQYEFEDAFQTILTLEGHQKSWGLSAGDPGGAENPLGTLRHLAGDYIRSKAFTHIKAGEFTKAVGLLCLLDGSNDNYDVQRRVICELLARYILRDAEKNLTVGKLDSVWIGLFRVDKIIDIADYWKNYGSTTESDLIQTVFKDPASDKKTRKAIIDNNYRARDAVRNTAATKDVVSARNSILCRVRKIYEERLMEDLEESAFHEAFYVLQELDQFWEPQNTTVMEKIFRSEVKIEPTVDMRIIQKFLVSRQRVFDIPHHRGQGDTGNKKPPKDDADSIPAGTSLGFVYCLTNAEVSYFEKRDLEKALFWCQKAINLAGENIPNWVSKSDALYLLARVFERKDMPLDADYHYSLIPSFEEYDQWRIYGNPGRILRQLGDNPKLHRGKLVLSDTGIKNILNNIAQNPSTGAHGHVPDALIRAIYADDVSWSHSEIQWHTSVYKDLPFGGPFLHVLASAGPLKFLQIALHNPWVEIEEPDMVGNTAVHKAAKVYDEEKVLTLIQSGAKTTSLNNRGDSPLHNMLRFAVGETLAGADISGTLFLFVNIVLNKPPYSDLYLLESKNNEGQTPVDLLRTSLENELSRSESRNHLGYLKRFADAWGVISKLSHCPAEYKGDVTLGIPASRERDLENSARKHRWRASVQVARQNRQQIALSGSPAPTDAQPIRQIRAPVKPPVRNTAPREPALVKPPPKPPAKEKVGFTKRILDLF
ncbi:hypothetical protein TWF718_001883 [Orbilia javanica]|uniref:Uncharacterized protein n=1 Tax=Orbilia javanica TaxID=47235 RepID=A0AAN8NAE6_9PEZI